MFDIEKKSDAEWRQRLQDVRDECDNKLAELQKTLDASVYKHKQEEREATKLRYLLTYVLDYFLNERKLEIPKRDMDLFYLEEIINTYHIERVEDGGEEEV